MILIIITPDQEKFFEDKVDRVNLHLASGYPISLYPGHIQLAAALQEGQINYSINGLQKRISVSSGLLLVENDVVSCFVSWVESRS